MSLRRRFDNRGSSILGTEETQFNGMVAVEVLKNDDWSVAHKEQDDPQDHKHAQPIRFFKSLPVGSYPTNDMDTNTNEYRNAGQ
jgi:hypothetical protein